MFINLIQDKGVDSRQRFLYNNRRGVRTLALGDFLKKIRLEKGLSQRELADKSGISNSEISRIESGERQLSSPAVLKSLAFALNVSYSDFYKAAGYVDEPVEKPIIADHIDGIGDLTEEELEDVKKYIEFLKQRRK